MTVVLGDPYQGNWRIKPGHKRPISFIIFVTKALDELPDILRHHIKITGTAKISGDLETVKKELAANEHETFNSLNVKFFVKDGGPMLTLGVIPTEGRVFIEMHQTQPPLRGKFIKLCHDCYPEAQGETGTDLHRSESGYATSQVLAEPSIASSPSYDVAISFAGEDRQAARGLADSLTRRGSKVFYDEYEVASLWGKDLYQHLANVYTNKAKYCIIFISSHYARKLWTNHELRSAQARAFRERTEYILPIRLDDTSLPGVPETTGYLSWQEHTPESVADLVLMKLGNAP